MFISMLLGIYTSRLVLQALGETDYGIYTVVGGVVLMLNFLNATLVASTNRFIIMSLGNKSENNSNFHNTFLTSTRIHLRLSIIIILIAESIGLWFINTALNIPSDRMFAANIIYQFSIATIFITINISPLQAVIIAYEKMNIFAIISIIDVILKFVTSFYLLYTSWNRLIIYATSILVINCILYILYYLICKKKFNVHSRKFKGNKDPLIFKSMIKFSGWTIIGSLAGSLSNQGINILLNIFSGPTVNAARGLAMTFNNYVYSFVNNFTMAANPQIIKTYSSKEYNIMCELIVKSIKFSIFLFSYLALPALYETQFILNLWLKDVPSYTQIFCQIIVLESFISCAERPLSTACNAIGCVKEVNLTIGLLYIGSFIISFLILLVTPNVIIPFIIHFITIGIGVISFLFFINKYIPFNYLYFIREIILKSIYTLIPTIITLTIIHNSINEGWIRIILTCISSTIFLTISIYKIGLNNQEKNSLIRIIKQKLYHHENHN